ncbi:MAG: arginine repressor [Candidatus Limnocylindria bacterium]
MTRTTNRREMVRQLVATGRLHSQSEIVAALAVRGIPATQATVSRDLAALGALRGTRGGRPAYLLPDDLLGAPEPTGLDRLRRLLADLPLIIDEAPPLLVLRTSPGAAHVIASAMDLSFFPGVVGTVAGDDTIFVACRDTASLRGLRTQVESLREGRSPPAAVSVGSS